MPVPTSSNPFPPTVSHPANSFFAPIHREFDRLFDQLGAGFPTLSDGGLTPKMDVRDTKEGLEITVELPGISKDEVKIAIEDDVLTISGEKQTEKETKEQDYRVCERSYGAFSRSIGLPRSIDTSKIQASMAEGVLKLTAPRNGSANRKEIKVETIG